MSLTEALEARVALGRKKIPTSILEVMDKTTNDLITQEISAQAFKVGDTFPSFELPNVKSQEVSLNTVKGEKATVISFYRGGWCPYCNLELQALQQALPEFKNLGANLVAISPETPDSSLTTEEKNELTFEVLSDIDNKLGKELGLVFKLDEELENIYSNEFKIDLEKHNQNTTGELPMAATYVIDNDHVIQYAFVKEDYTKRAEISEIRKALENI
ncbi:peroxiredoxin-like family protein [Tenacibaculum jejuense]|uniref:thioredoxin-dependent peroxiredoxin n=1 Tax=Tenacibaculum jejuense TaxID=584609 RepID=A0A238U786_9FLAO|nr:peroxiredoxin-like family protein [Tenacibaculum jejuense]SNR15017.1 Peroxiredoxin [Tenacibaculum jejuense]